MNNQIPTVSNIYYLGRNIEKDNQGYYLVFQTEKSVIANSRSFNSTMRMATYTEAHKYMNKLIDAGHTWMSPHIDPTI